MQVTPFMIDVPNEVLEDLQHRLKQTRWPDSPPNIGWKLGTDPVYLKSLTDYWINGYDWRSQEAILNLVPQFTTVIDGVKIHFQHIKGKGENSKPLLLTHGWPDGFYRFHKLIPMLTEGEQTFDVIIPSIPGFGFSDHVSQNPDKTAAQFNKLMQGLGYKQYFAAGGDMGSGITKSLANQFPEHVAAIHLTDVGYPDGSEDWSTMSKAEQEFGQFIQQWWYAEGAYAMLHSTKPQTLAIGLTDSPAGLASWIVEKFNTWRVQEGSIEDAFTKDELLTNIMIYWVTGTINSSIRTYSEGGTYGEGSDNKLAQDKKVNVPTGVAVFPGDAPMPREWADKKVNVQRFTVMPKGGHFAALEVPELFGNDLKAFFSNIPLKQ